MSKINEYTKKIENFKDVEDAIVEINYKITYLHEKTSAALEWIKYLKDKNKKLFNKLYNLQVVCYFGFTALALTTIYIFLN